MDTIALRLRVFGVLTLDYVRLLVMARDPGPATLQVCEALPWSCTSHAPYPMLSLCNLLTQSLSSTLLIVVSAFQSFGVKQIAQN